MPAPRGPRRTVDGGAIIWRFLPEEGPSFDGYSFVDVAELVDAGERQFVFAVQAYGEDRRIRAHVVGRCPSWVLGPAAAEGWALLQALRAACPGAWLYTDATRVLETVRAAQPGSLPRAASELCPIAVLLKSLLDDDGLVTFAWASGSGPQGSVADGIRAAHAAASEYRNPSRAALR